ncbi:MAG: S8 family serine peptidase [Flavobacterium sp.]
MTTLSKIKGFFILIFLFSNQWMMGQTPEEKKMILEKTNIKKLDSLKSKLISKTNAQKQRAIALAKSQDKPIFIENENGSFDELMGVLEDGSLYYYAIDNVDAARSTRTNHLNSGGSLGLNLNGQNMLGGVWDGGPARTTHNEFSGRVSLGDGETQLNNNSFHMTHVVGTIGAVGLNPDAKGMANQSLVKTFDWNNDTTEVIDEILNEGLLLSNHSYGTRASQAPSWLIGAYSTEASVWDEIAYAAPYYLMVTSAGNEGNFFNAEATTPLFDKLTTNKNSKNNLVIANAEDAVVNNNGNLVFVDINSSSSQGPTDDNRIKPDITGNGTGVFSTNSTNNNSYTTLSGTSMSGPNVMGTLLLLQQYHNQLHNNYMWSSTLKGLVCHTADDAGNVGPDVSFGWGLLNAKRAAETLTQNGLSAWVSEEILNNDETFTFTVRAAGNTPLIASITWTDVAGEPLNGQLNNPSPRLVQDLDIRVSNGNSTFFPWKLQANPNLIAIRTQDNFTDNVEQVRIENPSAQDYVITVTHKGDLVNNKQAFSLVVTGTTSSFAIRTKGNDYVICNNQNLTIPFDFVTNITSNVTFQAVNLPENVIANFSSNTSSVNASLTLNLSNFQNTPAGDYVIGISASNGLETEIRNIRLKIYSTNFEQMVYNAPANGQSTVATSSVFSWETNENAESYTFQLANNPNFETILFETEVTQTSFTYTDLLPETTYYWRAIPENRCAVSGNNTFAFFQTGIRLCDIVYAASDFSNAIIGEVANSTATVPIEVNENFSIANVIVHLDVSHTWVQDLTVYLEGPAAIGSPIITLIQEVCGEQDDFSANFTDAGGPIICNDNPAFSGDVAPQQSLSNFSNLSAQGTWNIIVVDNHNQDGGTINNAFLSFCNVSPILANLDLVHNNILTAINTDKIVLNSEVLASSQMPGNPQHTFTLVDLPDLGQLNKNGVPMVIGSTFTQTDVNQGNLVYSNDLSMPANDSFRVNILNSIQSWLPNQIINIQINETLSSAVFENHEIKIYPNPTNGIVNLNVGSFWQDANIIVHDLTGRKMMQRTISNSELAIDLSHLNEGLYMISVEKDEQKNTFKIFLKR